MQDLAVTLPGHDFRAVRAAMQRHVDGNLLPCVSWAVLRGRDLVDVDCVGWADREDKVPLRTDHIFRAYSNSKLVTSCAVLLLVEDGVLGLDDPVEKYLAQLGNRRVLRPGATTLDDTEPARGSITLRHLLTHSSGLSYGLLDIGTPMYNAYTARKILGSGNTLAQMVDDLADLPLSYHPGTRWEYSIATDVLARVVEVACGQRFDEFLSARIFTPLGMVDTGFVVPQVNRGRLVSLYMGASLTDLAKPGLTQTNDTPYPDAYLKPVPRQSGGGGLVTTLADMLALVRSLLPGGPTLLRADTLAAMMRNHLPQGVTIGFPRFGALPGRGYGLGGAVTFADPPGTAADTDGEFWWGGMAGTQWWISPKSNTAGVVMTQRQLAFWHPFFHEFRDEARRAMAGVDCV